jgi:general secretion pathway protein F
MPDFQYTARQSSGEQISGVLTAASEQDALVSLAGKQLFPLRVTIVEGSIHSGNVQTIKRVPNKYLTIYYTQLADLLKAGVPLLRSLNLLLEQASHPGLKAIIQDITEQVADGTRLATAMGRHPKTFNELVISMVRAGEEGGFLEDVLKRISAFNQHQEELKSRVVGAMVYPAFLTGAGAIIVTVMMLFFVPKFATIFAGMRERGELPWATESLLAISGYLERHWFKTAIVLGLAIWGALWKLQTPAGREKMDWFRLHAWGIGGIVRSLAIARFCRILGTLLHNGVPILQSLRIAKDATGNMILSRAIGDAADNVSSGKSLAQPLAASGQFPKEIMEMIAVGEEANNLEHVLIDISDNLERSTNLKLDMLVRLVEPVMLLLMAVIVVYIIFALLYPILLMSGLF